MMDVASTIKRTKKSKSTWKAQIDLNNSSNKKPKLFFVCPEINQWQIRQLWIKILSNWVQSDDTYAGLPPTYLITPTSSNVVLGIKTTFTDFKKICAVERFQEQLRKRWEKVLVGVCKWQGLGLTVLYFLKLTSHVDLTSRKDRKVEKGKNQGLTCFLKFTFPRKASVKFKICKNEYHKHPQKIFSFKIS